MKSLLLLTICMMFTAGSANGQGEMKREKRSETEITIADDDTTIITDKKASGFDSDDDDEKG